jgi:putative mRNA 3-end processing factor
LRLEFLGAAREVGRSCVRVQAGEIELLIDAGIKFAGRDTEFPQPMPLRADAVVVSHCHLDHSGYLPRFFASNNRKTPYMCTPPSDPLISFLLEDTIRIMESKRQRPYFGTRDLHNLARYCHPMAYRRPYEFFDGTQVEFLDAGHVLGSAQVLVRPRGRRKPLLYSGDVKMAQSKMHSGADLPSDEIGALVVESTYALREHPDRPALERQFCADVRNALSDGFSVLVPSFAVGRAQELLMILRDNRVRAQVYLDGMAQSATQLAMEYPSYMRDARSFREAVKMVHFVSEAKRRRLGEHSPCVIIATAGMLEGGPILSYVKRLSRTGRLKIFLTGFQVPGTNGRKLLETGVMRIDGRPFKVSSEVRMYDFSAHAGRDELFEYVEQANPEKVFCIHGEPESCVSFAEELKQRGFDAVAPEPQSAHEA